MLNFGGGTLFGSVTNLNPPNKIPNLKAELGVAWLRSLEKVPNIFSQMVVKNSDLPLVQSVNKKQPLQTSCETGSSFSKFQSQTNMQKLVENNLCLVIQAVTFFWRDGENVSDLLRT